MTERRKLAAKAIKMTTKLIELIDEKLSEQQWSPEQISGWLLKEKTLLSVMSAFISTYEITKDKAVIYTSIYDVRK